MDLINYNDKYKIATIAQEKYEHKLYLQDNYQDGYNLVVTLNGDGADKILDQYGNKLGYNYTNSSGNGSAATVEQIDSNSQGDANYSNLILGIDPKGSVEAYNETKATTASEATVNTVSNISEESNGGSIKTLSFELFSGAGNNGMKTIAKTGVEMQNSGLLASDCKVAVTLNDSPLDIDLIAKNLSEEEQAFLKGNTTFLLVGDSESGQWPKFGALPDRIYNNAVKLAKEGYEVQYIEYDPTEEEKEYYKEKCNGSWDHVGIDAWSKEHNLHLYHAGIVDEPNDIDSLEGKIHTFKLVAEGDPIPEGYEIKETFTKDGEAVILCEKIGGFADLKQSNISYSNGENADIIENSKTLVDNFTSNLSTCIGRMTNNIAEVTIANDITGIGGIINGYINSYNKITSNLYDKLTAEAKAIASYSSLFEATDKSLSSALNDSPIDNYDPTSEDEYEIQ